MFLAQGNYFEKSLAWNPVLQEIFFLVNTVTKYCTLYANRLLIYIAAKNENSTVGDESKTSYVSARNDIPRRFVTAKDDEPMLTELMKTRIYLILDVSGSSREYFLILAFGFFL